MKEISEKKISEKKPNIWDVAVIGGGPAGMMSAGRAGELGAKVILLEKNPELGRKLLVTGGGRCNVTNAEFDNRKFLEKFRGDGKFLFSAFSEWNSKNTIEFFESHSVPTKVENEGRVFPVSNSSESVLGVLLSYIKKGGVTVKTNSAVKELVGEAGIIKSVILENGEEIFAKSFIIATGGKSYPKTGSTGDGFVWLSKLGHKMIKPDSALVPVNIKDEWVRNLQGVAMPEIKISIFQDDKKIESKKGKILFTHFGISGPTILNMSRKINELIPYGDVIISLDLMPNFDFSTIKTELERIFKENINKKFKNALSSIVPSALVSTIAEKSGIDEDKPNHSITREEKIRLMHVLKDIRMEVHSLMSPENAIVSSGGVDLNEVDFKTMTSKLYPNLYLTGDILNINRPSGGYSLQICWTTGFVAGSNASSISKNI
ncbi:MAG: NAD(P)/FAD-dependent oxidoreductase [bacterium]|nr:NAD(P)/FAD-dependent oxidoreductase [bacterium]